MKLASKPPDATLATIDVRAARDYSKEKPASDESFRAYKGLYAYDKRVLAVHLDATEKADDWTTEIVSFDAGYGNERMIGYLCLPKNAPPPYQTVVYFPGSSAIHTNKKLEFVANEGYAAIVPKSGRALLFPIYKGTYQRSDDLQRDSRILPALSRDYMIAWAKDLRRSIDFLETRADIDHDKLAYLGFSWGGAVAPVMLAVEGPVQGGYPDFGRSRTLEHEHKHASRGRAVQLREPRSNSCPDAERSLRSQVSGGGLATSAFPSSRDARERQETRHLRVGPRPPRKDYIRESLDWLDKYLGPVKR